MDEIENLALALLASEYESSGLVGAAMHLRRAATLADLGVDERATLRAISTALRSAQVPEWRPIETAPRTGIAVLLWQPWKSGRDCTTIGHYANGWVDRQNEDMQPEPTHWMPLPAAPSAEG